MDSVGDRGLIGLDPVTGTFALPLWVAGVLAALFIVVAALAFSRNSSEGPIASVIRYGVVLVGSLIVWALIDWSLMPDDTAGWRGLESRAAELDARAMAPASPLACLDGTAGKTVEDACENALFATPQAAAAAASYTAAQLALLFEATRYEGSGDRLRDGFIARHRRSLEADPYGLVAHVLKTRYGCTAEQCAALSLLGDADIVRAHLQAGTYQGIVDRHFADWGGAASDAMANAPAATPPLASFKFPSAASIPPVSIMTGEPGAEPDTKAPTQPSPGRQQAQRRNTNPDQTTSSPVSSFGPVEPHTLPPPLVVD